MSAQTTYVKGHRLLASDVWNYLTGSESHSVEDAMENWELRRGAVEECVRYCESSAELLALESEEERRRLVEVGVRPGPPPSLG